MRISNGVRLKKLTLQDKALFDGFLKKARHGLSAYAFANIYIWKALFDIEWLLIDDNLCVFFRDAIGCFMYLEPLGDRVSPRAVEEAFRIMDSRNKNKEVSRIENAEEQSIDFYKSLGYCLSEKSIDYLCKRKELATLAGNSFKSKRASLNYFIKHYGFQCLSFFARYKKDCLALYDQWMGLRAGVSQDTIYTGMMRDSRKCLKALLDDCRKLDCRGIVVKVDNKVKAFSFGFELNKDTFCILYEISDLSVKGLSQFIFRQFCREAKSYTYINIMDDSGLENLKRVKLSYRPLNLIPAYIVKRSKD